MTIKIDSDIALPKRGGRTPLPSRWPLAEMKVGDSFALPESDSKTRMRNESAIRGDARRLSMIVAIRPYKGHYRCWRVAVSEYRPPKPKKPTPNVLSQDKPQFSAANGSKAHRI